MLLWDEAVFSTLKAVRNDFFASTRFSIRHLRKRELARASFKASFGRRLRINANFPIFGGRRCMRIFRRNRERDRNVRSERINPHVAFGQRQFLKVAIVQNDLFEIFRLFAVSRASAQFVNLQMAGASLRLDLKQHATLVRPAIGPIAE